MSLEIDQAYEYCKKVTKTHAKSFYFAAGFLPEYKRKAVFPIYAFCRHVDDEIDESGEGDEKSAIQAVENWKKNLDFVYREEEEEEKRRRGDEEKNEPEISNLKSAGIGNQASKITDQRSRIKDRKSRTEDQNLVLSAWRDVLKTYKIPRRLPLELIRGVLMDTNIKRYETFDELYIYCYRVASTVGLMSSEILGYSDKIALEYAEAMGIAMQLTNILRDIKEDAAIGRIYLPQEDLRKFRISEKQIFANEFDENFAEMMKFQIRRARRYYAQGEKGIALLEKDSRFTVLLAARIYAKILDEIEKQNYNIFTKRAHTTGSQKLFSIPKIWLEARKMRSEKSI